MITKNHSEIVKASLMPAIAMHQLLKEEAEEIVNLVRQTAANQGQNQAPEELWRTVEACKFLKCSKPTLLDQARKKGLSVVRFGSTLRFKKSEIFNMAGISL